MATDEAATVGPIARSCKAVTAAAVAIVAVALAVLTAPLVHVLVLAFGGLLLAVFLDALAGWVADRTPLGRRGALGLVGLTLLGSLVVAAWLVAPSVATQIDELTEAVPRATE